jgi:hypothetical protein
VGGHAHSKNNAAFGSGAGAQGCWCHRANNQANSLQVVTTSSSKQTGKQPHQSATSTSHSKQPHTRISDKRLEQEIMYVLSRS